MNIMDINSLLSSLPLIYQQTFQDPMYWQMGVLTLLISVGTFLLIALPWTVLAYFDPVSLQKYKIQKKPFQVGKYFLPNLARILINSSIFLILLTLSWPLFQHINTIHTGEFPAWYWVIAQLALFIFLDDFLYYWMHRAMHTRWLLVNVHSVHHRIKNTCALDGNYFHWIEFAATASLALVAPIILGAHLYVLWIWIVIRQFEAADGHCGYDFPYNPVKLIPFYHGAVYHDFHHARFKGNYAGFLSYLDGFMGNTYVPQYLAYLKEKRLLKLNKKTLSQNT